MIRRTSRFVLSITLCAIAAPHPAVAEPAFRGMSYTAFGQNVLLSAGSDQSIANMAAIGVDTVALNVWAFQDNQNSSVITLDFGPPEFSASLASIEHAIEEIHSHGMQVLLKPQIDLRNGVWRGEINPSVDWFNGYSTFMNDWAAFAQNNGVEMLSVGTEYKATESWEANWRNVIAGVRSQFSGPITYSANWDSYNSVAWWDDLDYVGIDAYFPLTSQDEPTLAQLQAVWQGWANTIQSWRTGQGLTQNVLFTEVGYRSLDGNFQTPWDFNVTGPVDLQEQADAYRALLTVMNARDWFDGAFWWSWETNPNAGGASNNGFTPQNKPAQDVVQEFYEGSGPPPSGGLVKQTLYSWETGVEGAIAYPFASHPVSLAQSTNGATHLDHGLAAGHSVASAGANHFNWNVQIDFTGAAYNALAAALADGAENYLLELDVTYDTDFIPQVPGLTFMNGSIAFQNAAGNWTQVDGIAGTNGRSDQTITVSIPLSSWSSLTPGSNAYRMIIALNGNWGAGAATVFYDNLALVNLNGLPGDYNGDGSVDAADYVIWRNSLDQSGSNLPADGDGDGRVTQADFDYWRARFGNSAGDGSRAGVETVPEPGGLASALLAAVIAIFSRPAGDRRRFLLSSCSSALPATH